MHKAGAQATSRISACVALDHNLGLLTLIAALLFLWPLLAYGRPGYIQDSASYYKGGKVAVTFVLDKLQGHPVMAEGVTATPSTGSAAASPAQGEVKGSRSVAYSLAAYVFGAPGAKLWLLCTFQALVTGFLCAVTFCLFAGDRRDNRYRIAILAVTTPVAFVVSLALPDIFAALIILVVTLVATSYQKLSRGTATLCVLIGAAGVAFHAGNLPIVFAMTLMALASLGWKALRQTKVAIGQVAAVLGPVAIGLAITFVFNAVAFGGASLTGNRYPLTLARSVSDGPGKWYLDKNCAHLKFAVCEIYPSGVPGSISDFLWGKDGLKERATPEQMDRIRAEESAVVMAATWAYPLQEVERIGYNFARQLVRFEPGVTTLDNNIVVDGDGQPSLQTVAYSRLWTGMVHWLTIATVLASLILLGRRLRDSAEARPVIVMISAGILVNAATCVYFSGIADRYNTRVIWLLPLLSLAFYRSGESGEARAV